MRGAAQPELFAVPVQRTSTEYALRAARSVTVAGATLTLAAEPDRDGIYRVSVAWEGATRDLETTSRTFDAAVTQALRSPYAQPWFAAGVAAGPEAFDGQPGNLEEWEGHFAYHEQAKSDDAGWRGLYVAVEPYRDAKPFKRWRVELHTARPGLFGAQFGAVRCVEGFAPAKALAARLLRIGHAHLAAEAVS